MSLKVSTPRLMLGGVSLSGSVCVVEGVAKASAIN